MWPQGGTVMNVSLGRSSTEQNRTDHSPSFSAHPLLRGREEQSCVWEEGKGGGKDLLKILLFLSLSYSGWIGDLVVVLLFKSYWFCFSKKSLLLMTISGE